MQDDSESALSSMKYAFCIIGIKGEHDLVEVARQTIFDSIELAKNWEAAGYEVTIFDLRRAPIIYRNGSAVFEETKLEDQ